MTNCSFKSSELLQCIEFQAKRFTCSSIVELVVDFSLDNGATIMRPYVDDLDDGIGVNMRRKCRTVPFEPSPYHGCRSFDSLSLFVVVDERDRFGLEGRRVVRGTHVRFRWPQGALLLVLVAHARIRGLVLVARGDDRRFASGMRNITGVGFETVLNLPALAVDDTLAVRLAGRLLGGNLGRLVLLGSQVLGQQTNHEVSKTFRVFLADVVHLYTARRVATHCLRQLVLVDLLIDVNHRGRD